MSNVKDQLTDSLEQINEYCNDSIKGYQEAADTVRDEKPELASKWSARAESRRLLSDRISERLRCMGESGKDSGEAKGAIHRGILKLKNAFSSDSVDATVKECLRGEEELRSEIDKCLGGDVVDEETAAALTELGSHVDQSIVELRAIKG